MGNDYRLMYDSVTVGDIPRSAKIVAGYYEGSYANLTAMRARFKKQPIVTVTPSGFSVDADVVDRETGDASPARAATWCERKLARGQRPTVYCNRSSWPAVKGALTRAGVDHGRVDFWIADWTGHPHPVPGAVAVQFADPSTSGGHYDLTAIYGHWDAIDGKTKPAKKPPVKKPKPDGVHLGALVMAMTQWLIVHFERRVADGRPLDSACRHRLVDLEAASAALRGVK